ncbi:MAG TPA: aconitate hydratase AcnA, partial [Anaerolineae bacterium]
VTPQVVGVKLYGTLHDGVTSTDLVLTITQILRRKGVVDKFVEFYGPGLSAISLPDRATIANMAPEYGATIGFFPTDAETLRYFRNTGRTRSADWLEIYTKEQGLYRTDTTPAPDFTETVELDLAEVEPSLAGPKRPEQRVAVRNLKAHLRETLVAPVSQGGYGLGQPATVDSQPPIGHGSVVMAAITSCTNTSNPSVMIGAGLLAKRAVEKGLTVKSHVKTSLSPGSQVVTEYLKKAGLLEYLERLGFFLTGYGCAVCVGNSGPLPDSVSKAIDERNLVVAAVLSGNRNFEGRIHPQIRANFLASPPLVVAYALAGTTDIDLETEPLGYGKDGQSVFLRDIFPSQREIAETTACALGPEMFTRVYANVFDGDPEWNALPVSDGNLFPWDSKSTYLVEPPFLKGWGLEGSRGSEIHGARVLALLGDGITTDHISPVGSIPKTCPAGKYLTAQGVAPEDFNQYGTRRGNHAVMMRGAFANIRLKNALLPGEEGGNTLHLPDGEKMTIFDAAMRYQAEGVPLVVIAGKEYGTGSSRDWA